MNMFLRALFTIVGLLVMATPTIMAQDVSGYPIGFCNGEMAERAAIKFPGKGAEVSAAIHIPATYAATVGGNRLESINVALASKANMESLEVWVRTSLEGENLASRSIAKGDFSQGWNNIPLDAPYDIPMEPGDGFFIGYTYRQTNKAGAISSLPEPHAGALYTKCNDEAWTDMSADGTLCIEGIVYGDNLPKYNLSLLSVTTDPYYIMTEGSLACVASVRNIATVTTTSFDIQAEVEGVETPATAHVECDIPLGGVKACKFIISPDIISSLPENRNVKFTITSVNGNQDEDESDNSAGSSFTVLERAFPRVVLAEEFTTEACSNCPRVIGYFHEICADPVFADNLNVVCHHAGYGSDILTTPFDEEYVWFYNNDGSTYAPGVMIDRQRVDDTNSPVFCPSSVEELESSILAQLKLPAMVSVNPSCSLDEASRKVEVTVSGERVGVNVLEDNRITVWLVEDNVKARRQAGTAGDFFHNHVNRAVNSAWGVPVEWSGEDYIYTCSFDIDEKWKIDDMSVVAFISPYNPENPNECAVSNSGSCPLRSSGVEGITGGSERKVSAVYTPDGVRLSEPAHGINIIIYDDNTVRKVIIK